MSSLLSLGSKHLVPVAILLTSSGSSGDRLLFQYPFGDVDRTSSTPSATSTVNISAPLPLTPGKITSSSLSIPASITSGVGNKHTRDTEDDVRSISAAASTITNSNNNPAYDALSVGSSTLMGDNGPVNSYALSLVEDLATEPSPRPTFFHQGPLSENDRSTLANLLAVQKNMCGTKLDIKVDDVVFVGYPCHDEKAGSTFSVVFVMNAIAPPDVIHSYYRLARQVTCAICHEEKRCQYLSVQRSSIHTVLDEHHTSCPFSYVLEKSQLCQELKLIKESVTATGKVFVKINNWIPVSHCMPHKAYTVTEAVQIDPLCVLKAVEGMRPYHSLLLLQQPVSNGLDNSSILAHLCDDACPTLLRLIKVADPPLRTLHTIATTIDVTYTHLVNLASELVLWGHAIIIYPLCETNCYVLAPGIDITFTEDLMIDFATHFPTLCLPELLAGFSTPIMLRDHNHVDDKFHTHLLSWLLRRRLLVQLHTYVSLALDEFPDNSTSLASPLPKPNFKRFSAATIDQLKQHVELAKLTSILQLPGAKDPDLLALFATLLPYLDGQWHIEHMMFRESKTRTEITRCIDMFSPILITTLLPDPVTSCFAGIT